MLEGCCLRAKHKLTLQSQFISRWANKISKTGDKGQDNLIFLKGIILILFDLVVVIFVVLAKLVVFVLIHSVVIFPFFYWIKNYF